MKLNQAGIDLIKRFEECRLTAYPDPGTGGEPWTIGWGSTGTDIHRGDVWTQAKADSRFLWDLSHISDKVSAMVKIELNDNQFSALVSFAYNCGLGNLKASSLLKYVNAGDFTDVPREFMKWNHANGKVLDGLTKRRHAEAELFLAKNLETE